jgi:hypothetical protein
LCCLSFFDLRLLITPLVSFGHCVVCPSLIYGFWLPLWYLQKCLAPVVSGGNIDRWTKLDNELNDLKQLIDIQNMHNRSCIAWYRNIIKNRLCGIYYNRKWNISKRKFLLSFILITKKSLLLYLRKENCRFNITRGHIVESKNVLRKEKSIYEFAHGNIFLLSYFFFSGKKYFIITTDGKVFLHTFLNC